MDINQAVSILLLLITFVFILILIRSILRKYIFLGEYIGKYIQKVLKIREIRSVLYQHKSLKMTDHSKFGDVGDESIQMPA